MKPHAINYTDGKVIFEIETMKAVENSIRDGIQTDGAHHKQEELFRVAEFLGIDISDLEDMKET